MAANGADFQAVIIGSGPNGLAAGITLAREGIKTLIVEARDTIGGGTRTKELTLPGFRHDVCSAVHPMGVLSPFFSQLPLQEHGLTWCHPEVLLAHPLDGGSAGVMYQDIRHTADGLPGGDGKRYRQFFGKLQSWLPSLVPGLLGPPLRFPEHPLKMGLFGLAAATSAQFLAKTLFKSPEAQALIAGNAAHSVLPLNRLMTSAIGLMLASAGHTVGWPVAKTGSQAIADALASYFTSLGGEIRTNHTVSSLAELPKAEAYLFDTAPRQMAAICAEQLPVAFAKRLLNYRHGPAAFKLDLALSEAIPWRNPTCRLAGTVHVGGTLAEICESERLIWQRNLSKKPFVLVGQQSVADNTRAPQGKHTCWAYAHVPSDYTGDASEAILSQIERFAPGFRDTILATHTMAPRDFERYNPSYIGGDIIGGVTDLRQILARPTLRWDPYSTPNKGIYLCSASTPPGGGVHGMNGYHAANSALHKVWHKQPAGG